VKILVLYANPREVYQTMQWQLIGELSKHKNVTIVRNGNPSDEQIKKCDVIYCHSPFAYLNDLKRIKKPKIAFIEDIWMPSPHGKLKQRVSHIIDKHCDCLFVRYKGNWVGGKWQKNWNRPWYYLPHCIDPQLFNDWKLPKDIGLLSIGQARQKKKYFLRNLFIDTFKDREDFYRLNQGHALAKDFSMFINRAVITGTSNGIGRIFAKTFEIPASMSLMACNETPYMDEAGFIPDENFILIDRKNLKEKILYYLERPEKVKEMTEKGFRLVHERHTVQRRAKEFFKYVNDFMGVGDGSKGL